MANVKDNELLPVYLIAGDDALKRETVMKRLRIRLEKLGDLSFNSDGFSGESATGQEIVAACQTIPFASEKRLVTVEDADKLKKKDMDQILEYLSSPNQTTVLALISQKNDKASKLAKTVSSFGKAAVIDCSRPKKRDLPKMVANMAKVRGMILTDKASIKLIELIGEDTVAIDAQLEKLSLALDLSKPVDVGDISIHVAQVSEIKPWEFVSSFSKRDIKGCMKALSLMPSVSYHALLSMCVSRIRELICAKSLDAKRMLSSNNLASELGMPEWKVRDIAQDSKRFSGDDLMSALMSAAETEKKMKSGSDPKSTFIDWMLAALSR